MATAIEQRRVVIQRAKLPEVTRRELAGRTQLEAVKRKATATRFKAEKEMALKQLQKVEQQFGAVKGVATIPAEKRRMAYEVLVNEINRNMRKHPYSLSGRGVRESMEAFASAGLDPQEAKRIYTKAIKTGTAYIYGEERAMDVKYMADVEKSLAESFPVIPTKTQDIFKPQFTSETQKEFYRKVISPAQEQLKTEQQRYKKLGYSPLESKKLAEESLRVGGMTFTPTKAKEIIKDIKLPERGKAIFKLTETGEGIYPTTKGYSYSPASFMQREKTPFEKVKDIYYTAEEQWSEKIPTIEEVAKPISTNILEWSGMSKQPKTEEELKELQEKILKWEKAEKFIRPFGEVGSGIYKGVQEQPIKTLAMTGAFILLPGAISGVRAGANILGVTDVLTKVPLVTKIVGGAIKIGLPVLYGVSVAKRVEQADNPTQAWEQYEKEIGEKGIPGGQRALTENEFMQEYEKVAISKGETFGRIVGTEIAPMLVGSDIGSKFWEYARGRWVTRGRAKIPVETLVKKEVIKGETLFPESPSKTHLYQFQKKGYGYHATGEQFWKTGRGFKISGAVKRPTDFPGLYTAPTISTYFLRLGGKQYKLYGGELFPTIKTPAVAKIYPTKYVPGKTAKIGQAFVPGIKAETEAIVTTGTQTKFLSGEKYFEWEGIRVPIDVYKTIGAEGITTTTTTPKITTPSYDFYPTTYATTPSGVGLGLVSAQEYKPTAEILSVPDSILSVPDKIIIKKPPYKPTPQYKPSYKALPSIYKPTAIPYKPLKDTFYTPEPTYKAPPSIKRKITPPYKITPRYEPPYRPPYKSPYIPIPPKLEVVTKAKGMRVLKKGEGEFSIYIRRFGKWKKVGEDLETLELAKTKAKNIIRTSLAVSYHIRKDDKPVKINILDPRFRPAKREPFVVVEKRRYRLSTSPEVKEIQMFKRKAPKRNPEKNVNFFGRTKKKKKRRRGISWLE